MTQTMTVKAKLIVSGLLMALGLCVAGILIFPTRDYLEKLWWSFPGEKAGSFVIATAAKQWLEHPIWYTHGSFRFEATGTAIAPLLNADAQWAGTITHQTADLIGQGQLQVQGITISPQAKVKYQNATVYVQLTEPVWPVKGFYVLAEKGGKWQVDQKYQSNLTDFYENLVTKHDWTTAETDSFKGNVYLKTQTWLQPHETTAILGDIFPGFGAEPSVLSVWVDPRTGTIRRASISLVLNAVPADDQVYSTDWQKMKGQLEMEFEPATETSEFVVPPDAQVIEDFWERLKPPIESSLSGEVLGVQLDAFGRPTARPTEVPFLTGWQKKLLQQHGFEVEER